jgi:hypothetical protein
MWLQIRARPRLSFCPAIFSDSIPETSRTTTSVTSHDDRQSRIRPQNVHVESKCQTSRSRRTSSFRKNFWRTVSSGTKRHRKKSTCGRVLLNANAEVFRMERARRCPLVQERTKNGRHCVTIKKREYLYKSCVILI